VLENQKPVSTTNRADKQHEHHAKNAARVGRLDRITKKNAKLKHCSEIDRSRTNRDYARDRQTMPTRKTIKAKPTNKTNPNQQAIHQPNNQ
jgi:hypothetical protein